MTTQATRTTAQLVEDYRDANTRAERAERLDCPLVLAAATADRERARQRMAGYDHLVAALHAESRALSALHTAIELGDQRSLDRRLARVTRVRASIAAILDRAAVPVCPRCSEPATAVERGLHNTFYQHRGTWNGRYCVAGPAIDND